MRIVYGAHTQGQGGLAKASVLVSHLEACGHDVCVVTSGTGPRGGYQFRQHRHFPGMEYVVDRGQTDYMKTFVTWSRQLPQVLRSISQLRQLCREFRPELVISDFEPLTGSPLLGPGCEVLAASRPAALIDPQVPIPDGGRFERRLFKSTIYLFTRGADRRFGYHFEPSSYRCLPPVVDAAVLELPAVQGEHLLVYNVFHTTGGNPADLVSWANRMRVPVVAYGFPEVIRRQRVGMVEFRRPSRAAFLQDLASARAVITTAGMSLPVEAFLLGKPTCVVPIPGQWEQTVNAFHLQEAGIARWLHSWDYQALLETPPPTVRADVLKWLRSGPLAVLKRLLPAEASLEVLPRKRVA